MLTVASDAFTDSQRTQLDNGIGDDVLEDKCEMVVWEVESEMSVLTTVPPPASQTMK